MATLSLLEAFGLEVSGSLKPNSHLGKAFSQLQHFQSVPLDQVQLASGKAELTFLEPIDLSFAGLALVIGAGLSGNVRIATSKDHKSDPDNPFDPIAIGADEIYLSSELVLSAKTGITIGPATCAFGLSVGKGFTVTVQRRFYRSDSGAFPGFGVALAELFRKFVIPQNREDLKSLGRDTVVMSGGTGQIKLTNGFGIAAPVKQLAATSPIAGKVVEVNTSATFTAELSLTLEGGYLSRVRKSESGALEIGISRSQSSTLAVQVSAAAGIVAGVGKFDLAEKFLGSISRNPIVDLEEFRRGIPGEDEAARELQISAFQESLGAAISTKVAASLIATLSSTRGTSPVLMFEVGADSFDSASTAAAIVSALDGNFTRLTSTPLPSGVKQTANIFTESELSKHKIAINLLGIVNYVSIGKLARISEVKRNADGEIVCVTDAADANRLQALLLNVVGNVKRLQSLLSEDFLLQATFKAVDLRIMPPDLSAKHTFVEITNKTDRHRIKDLLDICRTMGVLTAAEEAAWLQDREDFGRTTFWLQTVYAETAIEHTFLRSDGQARTEQEFVLLGRQALGHVIAGNEGQEFRKLVADLGPKGNSVWKAMDDSGNRANFNSIFGLPLDVKDPRIEAAGADYSCIKAWAAAMKALADAIVDTRRLIASSINADDDRLTALRQQLRDRMADVVKHSGEHFGDPLGLVTVYLASGRSAGARVLVTGASLQALDKVVAPGILDTAVKV